MAELVGGKLIPCPKQVEVLLSEQWLPLFLFIQCPPFPYLSLLVRPLTPTCVFWWGFKSSKRTGLCVKSWKAICRPKSVGGLGFRSSFAMNEALLAKMGWAMLTDADKLWVQLLKSKYCKGRPFSYVPQRSSDSWLWTGILNSRTLLGKGSCYLVGDGSKIDLWEDPWGLNVQGFCPTPMGIRRDGVNFVANLIIASTGQ